MSPNTDSAKTLYLQLLKQVLSQTLWDEPELVPVAPVELAQVVRLPDYRPLAPAKWHAKAVQRLFQAFGYELVRRGNGTGVAQWTALFQQLEQSGVRIRRERRLPEEQRAEGTFWPAHAATMIGMKRLDNLQICVEDVLGNNVPGDLIETGVWRGGACIFMQGVLKAHGCTDRAVWVADSFEGLPPPNPDAYPADTGDAHFQQDELRVSREQVEQNFRRYGLMDSNVKFLKGWFRETLPVAPIEKLAVARLDGDMYESTMDGLRNLYPKLSAGGYLIVDDYGAVEACRKAVEDYRKEHRIVEEIQMIDWTGVFWQKGRDA